MLELDRRKDPETSERFRLAEAGRGSRYAPSSRSIQNVPQVNSSRDTLIVGSILDEVSDTSGEMFPGAFLCCR